MSCSFLPVRAGRKALAWARARTQGRVGRSLRPRWSGATRRANEVSPHAAAIARAQQGFQKGGVVVSRSHNNICARAPRPAPAAPPHRRTAARGALGRARSRHSSRLVRGDLAAGCSPHGAANKPPQNTMHKRALSPRPSKHRVGRDTRCRRTRTFPPLFGFSCAVAALAAVSPCHLRAVSAALCAVSRSAQDVCRRQPKTPPQNKPTRFGPFCLIPPRFCFETRPFQVGLGT